MNLGEALIQCVDTYCKTLFEIEKIRADQQIKLLELNAKKEREALEHAHELALRKPKSRESAKQSEFSEECQNFNSMLGEGFFSQNDIGKLSKTRCWHLADFLAKNIEDSFSDLPQELLDMKGKKRRLSGFLTPILWSAILSARAEFWPKAVDLGYIAQAKTEIELKLMKYEPELVYIASNYIKSRWGNISGIPDLEYNSSLIASIVDSGGAALDQKNKREKEKELELEESNFVNSPFYKVVLKEIEKTPEFVDLEVLLYECEYYKYNKAYFSKNLEKSLSKALNFINLREDLTEKSASIVKDPDFNKFTLARLEKDRIMDAFKEVETEHDSWHETFEFTLKKYNAWPSHEILPLKKRKDLELKKAREKRKTPK